MHDLEITWASGNRRFSPDDSPVLIGRSSSASVVVPQGTVSRQHITITWTGRSWEAEDNSTHGTFDPIGVRLAATWSVGTDVIVRLGSPRGAELSMRLITRALEDVTAANPYADPDSPPTVVDFGPPPPPDQNPDGSGLLRISEHPQDSQFGAQPAQFEPELIEFDPNQPSPSSEPALFEQQSGAPDLEREPVPGTESFRPEPVSFQPAGETTPFADGPGDEAEIDLTAGSGSGSFASNDSANYATVDGAEQTASQQTLVDRTNSPVIDAPSVGNYTDRPADDLNLSESIIDLDGEGPALFGEPVPEQGNDPAATFVENDTLRLQIDGEDFGFLPGHEVTVGRDPHCTVTVDERHSLVSRRHLRFVHAEGTWWLEDASSKGTFVDGRRLNRPYKSEGAFIAHLGDGAAGTQLRVVTSGDHRRPTDRAGLAIAAVAAAALVIAALVAWFVFGGSDDSAEALSTAKKSTVMLLSESGHGSGFFVSDSIIVTNQHVAAMADQLVVAVSPQEDEPAEIEFVAELVENHPFLDVATVRITNRAEINASGTVTIGDAVDSADVPILQLGDSSGVTIGDAVTSTGFPGRFSVSSSDDAGQLRLAPVSTTRGQAANFTSWPGCSTPDLSSFIPADAPPTVTCSADGNIDKGVLLASFPSGEGASGSAVIHEDKVVAVLFAGDSEDATASRSITTNAFSEWIGKVLAEHG